jgi:hypothetical protein
VAVPAPVHHREGLAGLPAIRAQVLVAESEDRAR